MCDRPLFSIILPVFNVEKYIERCLYSCINQTYKNIEIIIVDDCGVDNSIRLATHIAESESRIKFVTYAHNRGTFLARKAGVEAAQGEFVLFLDPDDCLSHDAVETLYEAVSQTKVDIVFYGIKYLPVQDLHPLSSSLPQSPSAQMGGVLISVFCDPRMSLWGTAGKMYSRDVVLRAFSKLSFIEDRLVYAEDVLLLFSVAALAKNTCSVAKRLYVYHGNAESITAGGSAEANDYHVNQILLIVNALVVLSSNDDLIQLNGAALTKARKNVVARLSYEVGMLQRMSIDLASGKSLYLRSVFMSLRAKRNWKEIVRLIVYFLSVGQIKI